MEVNQSRSGGNLSGDEVLTNQEMEPVKGWRLNGQEMEVNQTGDGGN